MPQRRRLKDFLFRDLWLILSGIIVKTEGRFTASHVVAILTTPPTKCQLVYTNMDASIICPIHPKLFFLTQQEKIRRGEEEEIVVNKDFLGQAF